MDWQNLRLSLATARRRAGPLWVLHAVVEEVCRILPDSGPETGTTVWLFLTPASEHRADRVLLEFAAFPDPTIAVQIRCVDSDLIGIELTLRAADAWHEQPGATVAVVTDAGRFATVVRHYEDRPGRRPPWLLYLHEQPPASRGDPKGLGDARRPAAARRLRLPLDRPASMRQWNEWDRPAWALRRLAGQSDATVARRSLHADPAWRGSDPWREADLHTGVRLDALERVDNLVADLWRLEWGQPVEPSRVSAEAARRLRVGEADAAAAVDALLAAQFLRWHNADRLEVPSTWREGLLLPMRRVVLRLARRPDLTYPLDKLAQQHRRRFLGRPGRAESLDPRFSRIEHESRIESWRWVRRALLEHLQTVEERPNWRVGGATWTLTSSNFASATVETSRRILRRLGGAALAGRLEADLEHHDGIARPGRWLRCLRDVGLVRRQDDRWEPAGGELHLP